MKTTHDNYRFLLFFFTLCVYLIPCQRENAFADSCGRCRKLDIGPVFLQIDVLQHGKTEKRMELWGFKGDLNYVFENGFSIKPSVLYGGGDGYLTNGGLGLGWYIPINDKITIGPFIGFTYSYVKTKTHLPQFLLKDIQEQFQSLCGWGAVEAIWCFISTWRLIVSYQYGWCRTRTKLEVIPGKIDGHSQGSNYGIMLENDFIDNWSVNLGFGYNISLSKERHGLRAKGIKLGLAYWF